MNDDLGNLYNVNKTSRSELSNLCYSFLLIPWEIALFLLASHWFCKMDKIIILISKVIVVMFVFNKLISVVILCIFTDFVINCLCKSTS